MTPKPKPYRRRNHSLTSVHEAKRGPLVRNDNQSLPACSVCGKRFYPKQTYQRYCSSCCRLLAFYAARIAKLYAEGKAPGLGETIEGMKGKGA